MPNSELTSFARSAYKLQENKIECARERGAISFGGLCHPLFDQVSRRLAILLSALLLSRFTWLCFAMALYSQLHLQIAQLEESIGSGHGLLNARFHECDNIG